MKACLFFFSSRRRHTRCSRDWSSDVCSSDLLSPAPDTPGQKISVDQALAAQYVARARALGAAIGIGGGVTPAWGLERPRVGRPEGGDAPPPPTPPPIPPGAPTRAPHDLVAPRPAGGEALRAAP